MFYTKSEKEIDKDSTTFSGKLQREVLQTAITIRTLTNHHQDLTEQDRIDNSDQINILPDNITHDEIFQILNKNTTPGPDSIPYIALQRSPPALHKILTNL